MLLEQTGAVQPIKNKQNYSDFFYSSLQALYTKLLMGRREGLGKKPQEASRI